MKLKQWLEGLDIDSGLAVINFLQSSIYPWVSMEVSYESTRNCKPDNRKRKKGEKILLEQADSDAPIKILESNDVRHATN